MDNENKMNEGFDEIVPASSEKQDKEIENTISSEVQECTNDAAEAQEPAEAEPESYSPPYSGHGYMPTGNYGNQGGWQPETVYIRKPPKKERPQKENKVFGMSFLGLVAIMLVVALIGAASGIGAFYAMGFITPQSNESNASSNNSSNPPSTIIVENSTVGNVVEAVYQKASPSVVGIRTTVGVKNFFFGESQESGEGTGIIYSQDGYIITCFHVVDDIYESGVTSSKIEVFLPNDTENGIEATVVGYNRATDIALLKIDKTGLNSAHFGTSNSIKVGQFAVAIGNPGGLQFMSSVSYGVISGLNRSVSVEGLGEMSLVQTDAAINPGNSGGALVDTDGKVIAMNSAKFAGDKFEGMGFAIPIDTVLSIIENILENKDNPQPYLGIEYYTNVTAEWLEENNLPKGIIIKAITENSPAEYAGLRPGDIIVKFGGVAIENTDTFTNELSKYKPNDKVSIEIYRSGKYYTGNVTIGSNNAA